MHVPGVAPVRLALLAGLVLSMAASAAPPEPEPSRRASRAWVVEEEVDKVEIVAAGTEPPTFTLVLVRQMPTPGFTWKVDALDVDVRGRRITARLTESAPQGIVAQVITPTRFELPLGSLDTGSYFVELWTRRGPSGKHRPSHALVLEAH